MPLRVHPRLYLDIGWGDLWFGMAGRVASVADSAGAIRRAFGDERAIAALSVRSAFLALLRSLDAAPGSEVLMSAVNIENMADIVRACGFVPVPVDIDLDELAPTPDAVRACITEKTVLYLHAHLYGSRNPLNPYAAICRARGVLLVEDCAQAYDGRAYLGSPHADASLFSFGPIKPMTMLGGAVARIRDPALRARVEAEMSAWPEQPDSAIARRARKLMALKALSGPFAYARVLGLMKLRGIDADKAIGAAARGFKPGDLIAQISHRPSPRLLAVMARRLARPPGPRWRQEKAAALCDALRSEIFLPGRLAPDHAYWLFPILAEDPPSLIAALRQEGFDATRGATSMRVIGGGDAPIAELLIGQVVYLPLSPRVSLRDIGRMAGIVNRFAVSAMAEAA